MRTLLSSCLALSSLLFLEPVEAAVFYLRAAPTTITMPDTGEVVTMWGFAKDTTATSRDGFVTVPGPTLEVSPGDSTLTINLINELPALNGQGTPVSLIVPGQISAMTPVRNTDGRLRSFTHETSSGSTGVYTWNNIKPGTFIYQSGTHPALQVQMGLYGAVKKNVAASEAYPGISYQNEVLLHYSEVDPAFHATVASDDYGPGKSVASTINYRPKYFLVNGRPFSGTSLPLPGGSVNQRTLIRFMNSGLKTHVPAFQGTHVITVAEDGHPSPYPLQSYSVFLPAGKALDVLWTPSSSGLYPLYDRKLDLTNGKNIPGGMLTYLSVAP